MIVFKVSAVISSAIGGVRYRALLPALFLRRSGRKVEVVSTFSDELIQACEVAVFVKSFSSKDLKTFLELRRRGTRTFLDICDNIFVDGYSNNGIAERFEVMASIADGVITTSEALAVEIRRWCPSSNVILVPDPLETIDDLRAVEEAFSIDETPYVSSMTRNGLSRSRIGYSFKFLLWALRNPVRILQKVVRVGRAFVSGILNNLRNTAIFGSVMQALTAAWAIARNPLGFAQKVLRFGTEIIRNKLLELRRSKLSRGAGHLLSVLLWGVQNPLNFAKKTFSIRTALQKHWAIIQELPPEDQTSKSRQKEAEEKRKEAEEKKKKAEKKQKKAEKKRRVAEKKRKTAEKKQRAAKKRQSAGPENPETQYDKTILWFGNHGGQHSNYGMLTLLLIMPDLIRVSKRVNVRLLIVSNNRGKFNKFFKAAPFKVDYLKWDAHEIYNVFSIADVCLLPNTMDDFSKVKSANRAVSALYHGVPVVATKTLALQPFADCIAFNDFEQGMLRYLTDSEHGQRDVALAREVIDRTCSAAAITDIWEKKILNRDELARPTEQSQAERLMIVFSLVQDTDLLLPVVRRAQRDNRFDVKVVVLASLAYSSSRTISALRDVGADIWFVDKADIEGGGVLESIKPNIILTASETSASPHWAVHSLVRIANTKAIRTFTLQHGLENIGLTYFDEIHGEDIEFSSKKILTWCHPEKLPPQVPQETRAKSIFVGCPKDQLESASFEGFPLAGKKFVAIFENLHWRRYDDAYRSIFLEMVDDLTSGFPDVFFVIKPHPAGRWLTERYKGGQPSAANLIIADPLDVQWEAFAASTFLRDASAVITTPSTIALDAARVGRPVAVVTGLHSIDIYEGLTQIASSSDAEKFIRGALSGSAPGTEAHRFVDRWVSPTDAVASILDEMIP